MENSILFKKIYSLVSIIGSILTLYVMIDTLGFVSQIGIPILKLIFLVIYVPILISTIALIVTGVNTIFNSEKIFIGNIFKFELSNKDKSRSTKNTFLIGLVFLSFCLIDIVIMTYVNIGIVLPFVSTILLKILVLTFMVNTIWVFSFGLYRLIME